MDTIQFFQNNPTEREILKIRDYRMKYLLFHVTSTKIRIQYDLGNMDMELLLPFDTMMADFSQKKQRWESSRGAGSTNQNHIEGYSQITSTDMLINL